MPEDSALHVAATGHHTCAYRPQARGNIPLPRAPLVNCMDHVVLIRAMIRVNNAIRWCVVAHAGDVVTAGPPGHRVYVDFKEPLGPRDLEV